MKTLWINILGFSSGRTGWVITNGEEPYAPGTRKPISDNSGVLCRLDEDGHKTLLNLVKEVKQIKILPYSGKAKDANTVSRAVVKAALDPWSVARGEDTLVDLMPAAK